MFFPEFLERITFTLRKKKTILNNLFEIKGNFIDTLAVKIFSLC